MELEFLYLWQTDVIGSNPQWSPGEIRDMPHNSIQRALRRAGVQVHPVGYDVPDYSMWSVTDDPTVQLTEWDKGKRLKECKIDGAEVVSRVLRYEEAWWIGEVNQAVGALNSLNKPSGRRRVLPNLSCGFHVHVGQGAAGYTLEEMRRVFMVVTAFEHHLDQLHGASRMESDSYSKGPATYLSEHLRTPRTLAAWLRAIERFGLIDFPEKFCTYNFWNCEYHDRNLHTIEFRQHRGTLNAEEIKAWIDVAVSVVRFAVARSADEIVNFCLIHASDPNFSVSQLLHEIGVPSESRSFYWFRLVGNSKWLSRQMVGHRSDGFVTPVTDLSVFINDQSIRDVDMVNVVGVISDKFIRQGYGDFDDDLRRRICKGLWNSIEDKKKEHRVKEDEQMGQF